MPPMRPDVDVQLGVDFVVARSYSAFGQTTPNSLDVSQIVMRDASLEGVEWRAKEYVEDYGAYEGIRRICRTQCMRERGLVS